MRENARMGKKSFKKAATQKRTVGNEPEMNLSAFYSGPDDPAFAADVQAATDMADSLAARYKGRIATLDAETLAGAIEEYDAFQALAGKFSSYAYLYKAKDAVKYSSFFEKTMKSLTEIGNRSVFFGLEIAQTPAAGLEAKMATSPRLAKYRVFLEGAVKSQPHVLSEAEERLSLTKDMTGQDSWVRLYDKLIPSLEFKVGKEKMSMGQTLDRMSNPDRKERRRAYEALKKGYAPHEVTLTHITNTLLLDKMQDDQMRRYPHAVASRNLSNDIDDSMVESLNNAVKAAYPRISHRYYEIKRQMLGLKKLAYYDRNAPLSTGAEDRIGYDEAKQIVLESFNKFSGTAGKIADMFFRNDWIDARTTKGKNEGAFSHSMTVLKHPVIFINYDGSRRDVATLAHEMGHGIHQYLAAQHTKSELLSNTPLTLAETASVFGEMLAFENILAKETDHGKRKLMLAGKIDDMINTVIRQIAFFNFEKDLHQAYRTQGELTGKEIGDIFVRNQKEALGPAFDLESDMGALYNGVSHFKHTPFYVYAYSFADCVVNSLYKIYRDTDDKEAFVDKYQKMLERGGSVSPDKALMEFGIDLRDPGFWDGGMQMIEEMIDRLEKEIALEKAPKAKKSHAPTAP